MHEAVQGTISCPLFSRPHLLRLLVTCSRPTLSSPSLPAFPSLLITPSLPHSPLFPAFAPGPSPSRPHLQGASRGRGGEGAGEPCGSHECMACNHGNAITELLLESIRDDDTMTLGPGSATIGSVLSGGSAPQVEPVQTAHCRVSDGRSAILGWSRHLLSSTARL